MGKLGLLHMAVGNVKLEKSSAFAQKDKHRVFKKTRQFHSMNSTLWIPTSISNFQFQKDPAVPLYEFQLKRIENVSAQKLV